MKQQIRGSSEADLNYPWKNQLEDLVEKKIVKQKFIWGLEKKLLEIRLLHNLRKMKLTDVLDYDNDPNLSRSFTPIQHFTDLMAYDPQFPQEIRKMIAAIKPEKQN